MPDFIADTLVHQRWMEAYPIRLPFYRKVVWHPFSARKERLFMADANKPLVLRGMDLFNRAA